MLVLRIALCVLTFVMLIISSVIYEKHSKYTEVGKTVLLLAATFGVLFCVLLVLTHWTLFAIPKILLFILLALMCFPDDVVSWIVYLILLIATVIAYIVGGVLYYKNIQSAADVNITTRTIVSAKDNSAIKGGMSGSVFYIGGSINEESVYRYYYQLDDGGIKLDSINADETTIYYIEDGEQPYVEIIDTTEYWVDKNDNPPSRMKYSTTTTYKLHVPRGSVQNVFQFDAE